jgi:hypothetical protein
MLKRLLIVLLMLALGALSLVSAQDNTPLPTGLPPTATPIPRPLPTAALTQDRTTVEFYFSALPQGQAGLVHAAGAGLAGARARFLNQLIDFFPVPGDGYYGLLSVSMEQNPRQYDLDIYVWYDDQTRATISSQVEVVVGDFIRQNVDLAPDKTYLIDAEIERTELARLESVFGSFTPEMLWAGSGFDLPIPGGTLTSPFGAFRTFNQTFPTRHTGWDIKATQGQPLMASGAGRVAFAGLLDIRGNIVVLDHGYGVYSTYSHLSQIHVTRGQSISKGQIIGTVGNTGRTSGAHFHWEFAVNDVFVDPVLFTQTWLPGEGG